MISYFVMVNAWSLLYDVLNGTLDKEYPIVNKKEIDEKTGLWREPDPVDPNLDKIERMGGFEWTPGSPWPPRDPDDDGLDYETDYCSDIDDMYSHHFFTEKSMKTDHNFKYHEDEILKDIQEYVSRTYQGHYTGTKHEFRKVQTIDLMAARDIAPQFCQANILKYGSRYGSKDGKNKTDLLKVIHYAMLLLHFDGHYGEPSMPSGNFDQMP
tara:strand:+ start:263 stop:895 length:633 start_codon:yes stop_codon:yes gene_type:complete